MSETTNKVISMMNEETIVRYNAIYLSQWEKLHLVNALNSEVRTLIEWKAKAVEDPSYWDGQIRITKNLLEVIEKQI